jgi:hypothetical protein
MSLFSRTWPNTSNQPALNPITLQPEHKTERMVHARLQRGTLHCAFTYPTSLVRQATRAAGRERCAYVLAISDKKEDRRVPEAEEEPALRRARARALARRCAVLYCAAASEMVEGACVPSYCVLLYPHNDLPHLLIPTSNCRGCFAHDGDGRKRMLSRSPRTE